MLSPWWERFPGRFEHELALLEAAGYAPVPDSAAKEAGLARIALTVHVDGIGPVPMTATFPDHYPYFRPEVTAPTLDLPHHQHPFAKNLCLLGRSTANWNTEDTLAGILATQIAPAVAAGAASPPPGPEREALPEERQAEPYSDYYTYAPNAMILVDGAWQIPPAAACGTLDIRFAGPVPPAEAPDSHTIGLVTQIRASDGTVLAAAPQQLVRRFTANGFPSRWSRLVAPVAVDDPAAIWAAAEAADPGPELQRVSVAGTPVQVRAVLFPEEAAWRESGDGWVFVIRRPGTALSSKPSKKRNMAAASRLTPGKHWLIRAGRAGKSDLAARVPSLAGIDTARVVLVGAGALGSGIAAQLARAGIGNLHTIDRDTLEPGNNVRHAAPHQHAGRHKAVATTIAANDQSPYLDAAFTSMPVGGVRNDPANASYADVLDDALKDADLLIDATAELGVQQLLADEAARHHVPYLLATATNGAWGGIVALIAPDHTQGCWTCLMHHLDDGTIPIPPADPTGDIQPPGCANPTFTGTGYDLDHIVVHAARTAAAELVRGQPNAYPPPPHGVAVLTLRRHDGTPTLPEWTGHDLTRHPLCRNH